MCNQAHLLWICFAYISSFHILQVNHKSTLLRWIWTSVICWCWGITAGHKTIGTTRWKLSRLWFLNVELSGYKYCTFLYHFVPEFFRKGGGHSKACWRCWPICFVTVHFISLRRNWYLCLRADVMFLLTYLQQLMLTFMLQNSYTQMYACCWSFKRLKVIDKLSTFNKQQPVSFMVKSK